MTAKEKPFTIPKTLGACADLLFETRAKRLALQKEVDKLAENEGQVRDHIINTLPKSDASGVAGKLCRVTVTTKVVPQVKDWDLFYKYVQRTKQFDLLQRRLADAAIKERWEAGKKVDGVEGFTAVTLSVNKL